jgi:hypothetical protein
VCTAADASLPLRLLSGMLPLQPHISPTVSSLNAAASTATQPASTVDHVRASMHAECCCCAIPRPNARAGQSKEHAKEHAAIESCISHYCNSGMHPASSTRAEEAEGNNVCLRMLKIT